MPRSIRSGYRRSTRKNPSARGYTLRGRNGRVRYVGVTNNPTRRAAQHKRAGKTGSMKVETRGLSRSGALTWERRRLAAYRRNHGGKNPSQNKTRNGGWRF